MSTIQSLGIGSGLKIDEIVTAIVDAEKVPKEQSLIKKEDVINAKISAYGEMKSKLSTLQSSVSSLRLTGSYNKKEATSSDESAFTATASSLAVNGSYAVNVTQLAQAQSVSTAAFGSIDDVIGTGTLTIGFGETTLTPGALPEDPPSYAFLQDTSAEEQTITIDSSNNTLSGLQDHINENDYGFKASIVNDGVGFRLVLTAESGSNKSLQISAVDDDGNNTNAAGLSQLAYNDSVQNLTQNLAGQNALLTINGIQVTSETNSIANAVKGLTLNLIEVTESPRSVSVSSNNSGIKEQVTSMVEAYNDLITYTSELTAYSSTTEEGSLLLGDSTVRTMVNQLRTTMFSQVSGVSSGLQALSNIGILSTQNDGSLEFDEAKFDDVLASSADQFEALFSSSGTTTDANIQFISNTSATKQGEYDITISRLATKGTYTGNGILPNFGGGASIDIDADNDNFTVRVNGKNSGELTLASGNFSTGEALAQNIQDTINNASAFRDQGVSVSVTYNAAENRFDFESSEYGSGSGIAFNTVDTNSALELGLFIDAGLAGVNVAGTINGVAGVGSGQFLSINSGDAAGLKIAVTGGLVDPGGEPRGSVTFSRGVADQLNTLLDNFLRDGDGFLDSRLEGLDASLATIAKSKLDLEFTMERFEARVLAQFNAIDVVVNQLNNLGSFLETALANLPGSTKKE